MACVLLVDDADSHSGKIIDGIGACTIGGKAISYVGARITGDSDSEHDPGNVVQQVGTRHTYVGCANGGSGHVIALSCDVASNCGATFSGITRTGTVIE